MAKKLQLQRSPDVRLKSRPQPAAAPAPPDQNAERDSLAEMDEVQAGFRARARREEGRYWDAVDSEYWFCLCFQTRAQKDEFLAAMGWLPLGDKYLDGLAVAKKLGVALKSPTPPRPRLRIDKKLAALAGEED